MRFDVLTLFPQIFAGYLGQSLLKKAVDRGLVQVQVHDLRAWSQDKHHKVDDRPYGGGPGMVLRVEPVVECVEAVQRAAEPGHVVLLTPQGRRLSQGVVEELAAKPRLLLLCGRYEGFDQRVVELLQPDESIGRRLCAERRRSGGDGRHRRRNPLGAGRARRRRQPKGRFVFDGQSAPGICPVHAPPRVPGFAGAGSVVEW